MDEKEVNDKIRKWVDACTAMGGTAEIRREPDKVHFKCDSTTIKKIGPKVGDDDGRREG